MLGFEPRTLYDLGECSAPEPHLQCTRLNVIICISTPPHDIDESVCDGPQYSHCLDCKTSRMLTLTGLFQPLLLPCLFPIYHIYAFTHMHTHAHSHKHVSHTHRQHITYTQVYKKCFLFYFVFVCFETSSFFITCLFWNSLCRAGWP